MRIITPGRKPLAHINPIGGTDMGGGTDETGGDTLYARGPKGEGTPGMHMLLPKMKPPARKSKVVGHIREGAGGRQLVPPTLPEGTDIRGHMSVLLLTKSGRVEEISHF